MNTKKMTLAEKINEMMKNYGREKQGRMEFVKKFIQKDLTHFFG